MTSPHPESAKTIGKLRVCRGPIRRRLETVPQTASATVSITSALAIAGGLLLVMAAIKLVVINPELLKESFSLPIAVDSAELEVESEPVSESLTKPPLTPPPTPPHQVTPNQTAAVPTVPLLPVNDLVVKVPDMTETLEEMDKVKELEKEEEQKKLEEEQQRLAQQEADRKKKEQDQALAAARQKSQQAAEAKRRAELAKKNDEANRRAALAKKVSANPSVTRRISPVYPRSARASGLQGTTRILATITTSGKVSSPRVVTSSGHRSLDSAALAAVRKWRFSPAKNGIGQAIAQQITIPVSFRLN